MQLIEKQFNTFIVLVIRILEMNSNIENENIVFNDAQKQEINKLLLVLECYIYRRTYVKLPEKVISKKMSEIKLNKNNYSNLEEQLFYELYKKDKAFRMPSFEEFCDIMGKEYSEEKISEITGIPKELLFSTITLIFRFLLFITSNSWIFIWKPPSPQKAITRSAVNDEPIAAGRENPIEPSPPEVIANPDFL